MYIILQNCDIFQQRSSGNIIRWDWIIMIINRRYKEGLNIKSISHLYRECHGICHATSRMKADQTVNTALDEKLLNERKWTRKGSITVESEKIYQSVLTNPQDNTPAKCNSKISKVKTKVKNTIQEDINNAWHNHIKDLVVQGQFLRLFTNGKRKYNLEINSL